MCSHLLKVGRAARVFEDTHWRCCISSYTALLRSHQIGVHSPSSCVSMSALNRKLDYEKLAEELSKYGYVRFVVTDIHGISKHQLVPARHALEYSEGGVPILNGKRFIKCLLC